MSRSTRLLCLAVVVLLSVTGCKKKPHPAPTMDSTSPTSSTSAMTTTTTQATEPTTINGEQVVHLTRKRTGDNAQFLGLTVLPGRGMNVFQITGYVPGKGTVELLASPTLSDAASTLNGKGADNYGNASFSFGGAFLVPYPNRIFGKVSKDGKTITTRWHGQKIVLPANWGNSADPSKDKAAMHGLILESKTEDVQVLHTPDGETLVGTIHARNFDGHWPSNTDLHFTIALTGEALDAEITATNVGKKPEPMGIGWHPYFRILSGQRAQAKLYLPARKRALVNNYQVEKPTGKLEPVKGTKYDFNVPGGQALDNLYLDDNFSDLVRQNDTVDVKLIDPAANYGIEEMGLSPAIQTVQVYSPPNKDFAAIEEQFNYVDPFGKEWHGKDTGMVTVGPNESVTWHVRLHLFEPDNK